MHVEGLLGLHGEQVSPLILTEYDPEAVLIKAPDSRLMLNGPELTGTSFAALLGTICLLYIEGSGTNIVHA